MGARTQRACGSWRGSAQASCRGLRGCLGSCSSWDRWGPGTHRGASEVASERGMKGRNSQRGPQPSPGVPVSPAAVGPGRLWAPGFPPTWGLCVIPRSLVSSRLTRGRFSSRRREPCPPQLLPAPSQVRRSLCPLRVTRWGQGRMSQESLYSWDQLLGGDPGVPFLPLTLSCRDLVGRTGDLTALTP